jgi:hypothetical protein
VTDIGDGVTGNYVQLMRDRGWGWEELAADFERQAQQPQMDGGEVMRRMARWARTNAEAGQLRAAAAVTLDDVLPAPQQATSDPPRRRG